MSKQRTNWKAKFHQLNEKHDMVCQQKTHLYRTLVDMTLKFHHHGRVSLSREEREDAEGWNILVAGDDSRTVFRLLDPTGKFVDTGHGYTLQGNKEEDDE